MNLAAVLFRFLVSFQKVLEAGLGVPHPGLIVDLLCDHGQLHMQLVCLVKQFPQLSVTV